VGRPGWRSGTRLPAPLRRPRGLADVVCVVVLAYALNVAVAIAMHALVAASIGTLAPAFFDLLSG